MSQTLGAKEMPMHHPVHPKVVSTTPENEGYTINFNNISAIEFLRFVSRISGVNFIYEEAELRFPVTITSEDPASVDDVIAILIQVLRTQGFELLDQGENLLIHKNPGVNQIATVVSEEVPYNGNEPLPMVTRVFRIHNTLPSQLVGLIKPMMSENALIEGFDVTRQLICTDNTPNVDKIGLLLQSLDAPHLALDIDAYTARESTPEGLIGIAEQIMTPLAEGNPVIMVPQAETKTIFVISTPYLIERALAILEDLDNPTLFRELRNENILLYKLKYKSAEAVEGALENIANSFEDQGFTSAGLVESIHSMRYIKENHSLLFTGPPEALEKITDLLATIDAPRSMSGANTTFYIYKPKYKSPQVLASDLKDLGNHLAKVEISNPDLINTIDHLKIVKKTQSIVFTGPKDALDELQRILPTLDIPTDEQKIREEIGPSSDFTMYTPKYRTGPQLIDSLEQLAKDLRHSELADPSLIYTLGTAKYDQATNTILFTGNEETLERVQNVLTMIDTQADTTNFLFYKPKFKTPKEIKKNLTDIGESLEDANLADPALLASIDSMRQDKRSGSLIFTGNPESLAKLKELLTEIDRPTDQAIKTVGKTTFLIYQPKNVTAPELMQSLKAVTSQISTTDFPDKELIETIQSMRYVKETNSIIFTGPEDVLEKLEVILAKFDIPSLAAIQKVGKSTFLVYQPKYISVTQLSSSLEAVASDLERSENPDESLVNTIENMRTSTDSKTITFTGPEATLEKVQALIEKFDSPAFSDRIGGPETYLLYTPKHQHGEELIETMKDFEKNLVTSGVQQQALFDVINNLKWIEKTCKILISGDETAVKEVEVLLAQFDTLIDDYDEGEIETFEDVSFLIYKLQYHRGDTIKEALNLVATDLRQVHDSKSQAPSEATTNLIDSINSVQWLEVTNSLIGTGTPETLSRLKELMQNLDAPLRQVFIEVLVVETLLTNDLDIGLRWGSQGKYRNKLGWGVGSFPNFDEGTDPAADFNTNFEAINATRTPTGQDIPFPSGFDLGVIGDLIFHKGRSYASLGSFLNAAKRDGDVTIVLDQKIITQDGKNSTLFVGDNIPFTGSTVANQSATTLLTSNIEYMDIGVSLSITPTLGDNDIVTLDIDEEITQQLNQPGSTTNDNITTVATGIATSKTSTTTSVAVPDRHFLVLSGMIRDSTTHDLQSIPCLGGIPVLGLAFQNKQTDITKKNVIIFIKPHIIHSFTEYEKITASQEAKTRAHGIPEDVDKGFDLVQTPEDE